jgi:hypothetical protein
VTGWTGGAESDLVAPPPLKVTSGMGDLDCKGGWRLQSLVRGQRKVF